MTATFYLGTHEPHWLGLVNVSLFVSHRRLTRYRTLPRAQGSWALDSGGFTELSMHGRWSTAPDAYIAAVRRYSDEVGGLDWCAPQDWMCAPAVLAKTGLTVEEHQDRTIDSYLHLSEHLPGLVVPVVQGWRRDDYLRCVDLYAARGVDLDTLPVVGVGSVCRRNADSAIGEIVRSLASLGLRLHGFGIRGRAFASLRDELASADSMAWSAAGRRLQVPGHTHKNCANCLPYALDWRRLLLQRASEPRRQMVLEFGSAA